jgi:hypothetical protein
MIIMRKKRRGVGVKQPIRKKIRGSTLEFIGHKFWQMRKNFMH